jgi:hypothetical protein
MKEINSREINWPRQTSDDEVGEHAEANKVYETKKKERERERERARNQLSFNIY